MDIATSDAYRLCRDVLTCQGNTPAHADTMSKILMYAQLRNPDAGQGLAKLRSPGMSANISQGKITIDQGTASFAAVYGNGNPGMVVMDFATSITLEKIVNQPISMVITRNTNPSVASSSTGAIGYYADRIASAGYACIVIAKPAVALAAPHGSIDRIFSTNPIAYGFPSGVGPTVADLTTAGSSFFQIVEAMKNNQAVPDGVGVDKEGRNTVIAQDIVKGGAIKTFGGAKGSAMAYAVEAFSAFFGCSYAGKHPERGWFTMIVAMNPDYGWDISQHEDAIYSLNSTIRTSRPVESGPRPRVPGEGGSHRASAEPIHIEDSLYEDLVAQIKTRGKS